MMLNFEDVPLMLCGHPVGSFSGTAEINVAIPEVIGLWLSATDGTQLDVYAQPPGAFSDFQKREMCKAILTDYRRDIEEEYAAVFANRKREYEPGRLLASELR